MSIQIGKKMEAAYKKIKNQIITDIVKGTLKPGDRIPAESKLCEDYSVVRITASRAERSCGAGYLCAGAAAAVCGGRPPRRALQTLRASERFRGRGLQHGDRYKMMPAPKMWSIIFRFQTHSNDSAKGCAVDGKPLCLSIYNRS